MKKALLLACALALASGCSPISEEPNQPPVAHVPTISHELTYGETVELSGYGTDADGEIVGYLWRSALDGELSRLATFETDSLSVGDHAIDFMVQDNNDAWSEAARLSVKVLPSVAAAPEVNSFAASLRSIRAGQSVTLSWNVSNATAVVIDQGIGTVPESGSVVVSPVVTTTYVLAATRDGSSATAGVTVAVDPVQAIVLTPNIDLSGYVRMSGYTPYGEIYVGDDEADRGMRGFLTYRVSKIPDDAVITRVLVDMSGYGVPYDNPFPGLGCLSVFEHPYNTLQGQYMMPGLPGVLEKWCELSELDAPKESAGLRDAVQQKVGESRLQLRLQFAEMESDVDQTRDILRWRPPNLPTLTVEYYTGDTPG
ncbi:MAG: hypothetical protein JW955_10295 [Sedimentisphaerales bacterium]|nr:hypothetical protein [Sedimentisphaerales bacterium]